MNLINILIAVPFILCLPLAFIGLLVEIKLNKKVGRLLQYTGAFLFVIVIFEMLIFVLSVFLKENDLTYRNFLVGHQDEWRQYVVECIDDIDTIEMIDKHIASELKNKKVESITSITKEDVVSYSSLKPNGYVTVKIAYQNSKKKVKVNVPYELLFFSDLDEDGFSLKWEHFLSLV